MKKRKNLKSFKGLRHKATTVKAKEKDIKPMLSQKPKLNKKN